MSANAIFTLGILFGIVNGSSRFLWGFLMDKLGFKTLMFIITIIEVTVGSTLYFMVEYEAIFVIEVLLIGACIGGNFVILAPTFKKIFGLQIGPELYGITGNFIGFASLCGPLMTNFILKTKKDFLIVFLIGGGLCMIKLYFTLMFDEDDKYVYKCEYEYKEKIDELLNEQSNKKGNDETIREIIDDDE